ncbi:unnamed protein product [Microthlaspi erraticum]|uniref:F-box domain-containing protein n=1 Tax=Microthlaspi erraticum TaxID=1685480 RepID=A0A6D2KHH5_9BRAS|nr:unnamed protein product [Microthlaspi erraticum]
MAPETLPLELEEEILIRVPPLCLVPFRIVCKRWNALFHNERFVKSHLALPSPEFIITTESKLYHASVNLDYDPKIKSVNLDYDPKIKVRETNLDIPGLGSSERTKYRHCDGLLLCTRDNGVTIWNPWLSQTRRIESEAQLSSFFYGLGYDCRAPEKNYKIVCAVYLWRGRQIAIYEFATNAWKYIDACFEETSMKGIFGQPYSNVSLNGNLYWIAYYDIYTWIFHPKFRLSKEMFKNFCILPCQGRYPDNHALAVFKGDRFSLLEQCEKTRRIQIWVTANKVEYNNGDVVWIKFMTVLTLNCPLLSNSSSPSYFVDGNIYGKSLIICCIDEYLQACIFIVRGGLSRKIQLESVVGKVCLSLCVSSLIPIPWESSEQENNTNLDV